ncbi:MAG: glucose-6-phosphate dehydrogenase [Aestuariivita sp.]|nr:glucose-6-phosphate dehydrogenase [Aestuariivita sp.]MCY4347175.1 glucose-6-phosphate dehydrogenase [Aestuariivita sp.]
MVSRVIPVDEFDLVIIGVTGDLALRKILPGLFHRFVVGQMPSGARIIGSARREMDRRGFESMVRECLENSEETAPPKPDMVENFLDCMVYVSMDATEEGEWSKLSTELRSDVVRAFCLSVSPALFEVIALRLNASGVANSDSRIIVEKPFGHDLAAAQSLNKSLLVAFEESQIYRIDHYLGKETVQNLMALRFANALWEPLWNSTHIDHVQITVAETVGVSGRGDYYDRSGAVRDMVQNHMLQLLCLTAMEPPAKFEPDAVRNEKVKVIAALEAVDEHDIVRGQYGARDGHDCYQSDVHNAASKTESFVAMKLRIGNWRWANTPFYLRTGKKLKARSSEVAIIFRDPPHMIFPKSIGRKSNSLVIRLQPDEGIELHNTIKEPGPGGFRLMNTSLDMTFASAVNEVAVPQDAYERLIMDVIRGDQTLFMRGDEVEAAWAWVDPVIARWEETDQSPEIYDPGSSGPEAALALMHREGRRWRDLG